MAKPINIRARRVSTKDAIRLHAEAHKSDPFAAKRVAMLLAKNPRETDHVAKEATRILDARATAIRKSYAAWVKTPEATMMREFVRAGRTYTEQAAA